MRVRLPPAEEAHQQLQSLCHYSHLLAELSQPGIVKPDDLILTRAGLAHCFTQLVEAADQIMAATTAQCLTRFRGRQMLSTILRQGKAMHPLLQNVRPKVIACHSVAMLLLGTAVLSLPFVRYATAATTNPEAAQHAVVEANGEPREPRERSAAIEAELKRSPGHAWAGDYYEGDGLGANIRMQISPVAGVAATLHGCLGLYEANEGKVSILPDGSLRLDFVRSEGEESSRFPDRVAPIRWGERRYLIPPSAMPDFVAAINQGDEPRAEAHGRFLLATGDELKNVDGLPALPAEHLRAIRTHSLHAGFVAARQLPDERIFEEMCTKRYAVDIALDESDQPVRPGDVFMTEFPRNTFADLSVVSVDGNRASGVIEVLELDCRHPDSIPDRTWKFATGAYDMAAANRRIDERRISVTEK